MQASRAALDHIVVAADTLDRGTAYIADMLGVEPAGGGRHEGVGTHNRLLKVARGSYLEVIAIDRDAPKPDFPRWFDLDNPAFQARLKIKPRLAAWVVRCDAIDLLAADLFGPRARVQSMQRGALTWRFAGPDDGSLPRGGLIPHLIQWDVPDPPAAMMPASGCHLTGLEGIHADPASVQAVISRLGLEDTIAIHAVSTGLPEGLRARIETPGGIMVLD
jgi:hypothetical protein